MDYARLLSIVYQRKPGSIQNRAYANNPRVSREYQGNDNENRCRVVEQCADSEQDLHQVNEVERWKEIDEKYGQRFQLYQIFYGQGKRGCLKELMFSVVGQYWWMAELCDVSSDSSMLTALRLRSLKKTAWEHWTHLTARPLCWRVPFDSSRVARSGRVIIFEMDIKCIRTFKQKGVMSRGYN